MIRVYESNPIEPNFVCASTNRPVAGQPFSGCGNCQFMSGMSCTASTQHFAQNLKKALHLV